MITIQTIHYKSFESLSNAHVILTTLKDLLFPW